jgi:hypothetical protein
METKLYTLKQVCEIVDESPKRIQYWILQRLFEPFDPGSGTGTARKFSFKNLLEISIASALCKTTIYIRIVRYIMSQIHRDAPDFFEENNGFDGGHEKDVLLVVQMVGESTVSYVFKQKTEVDYIPGMLSTGLPMLAISLQALKTNLLKRVGDL